MTTVLVTRGQATERIAKLFGLEAEETIDMFEVAETEDIETVNEVYLKYINKWVADKFADGDED